MRGPGAVPARVDNEVLRRWWGEHAWDKLLPVVEVLANRVASRMLRGANSDVAFDVQQETLVRCWRATVVPDVPTAFVRHVARNLVRDHFKKHATRQEGSTNYAGIASAAPTTLDQLVMDEARERLRKALHHVPEAMRRPLVLQVFHQRTTQELAEMFQCAEGAMRMRLVRARNALRAAYEDDAAGLPGAQFRMEVTDGRNQTVEVLTFLCRGGRKSRIGKLRMSSPVWHKVCAAMTQGFAAQNLTLCVDHQMTRSLPVRHGQTASSG